MYGFVDAAESTRAITINCFLKQRLPCKALGGMDAVVCAALVHVAHLAGHHEDHAPIEGFKEIDCGSTTLLD